ncbi:MAG: hypothetical protein AB1806_21575 [Acidobacteriota bacterium]
MLKSPVVVSVVVTLVLAGPVCAQTEPPGVASGPADAGTPGAERRESTGVQIAKFLGGAAAGLGVHELGHVVLGASVGATLRVKKVEFKGIPFFAITHGANLSRRQEFVVSSAGFWMQWATSEWILSANPRLRSDRRRFQEGVLAFHVGTSIMYAGASFARAGPYERDTRAMAETLGISERWIGLLVLAPAVLDAYRYFDPDAQWAAWASRGMKIGMVGLAFK